MKDHQRRDKPNRPDRDDITLRQLTYQIFSLVQKVKQMSAELDRVAAEVAQNGEVIDSAVVLLDKLAQLIRDNAGNPAALNKLADDLDASGNKLAAAVAANTPAEEPPAP